MHFQNHILVYVLLPLLVLTIGATFYRAVILHDYNVSYEGSCDSVVESCFVGCEDDECTQEYFYTIIKRYAPNLIANCGDNMGNCEAANICPLDETDCEITFCDPNLDIRMCDTI